MCAGWLLRGADRNSAVQDLLTTSPPARPVLPDGMELYGSYAQMPLAATPSLIPWPTDTRLYRVPPAPTRTPFERRPGTPAGQVPVMAPRKLIGSLATPGRTAVTQWPGPC
ncbi:DUF6283 family protein [Streptomyces californicus]|uniref:DUF6283 family protein n=1 Tax=Streptomyces californicus TaxID=67351 RepID=UPI0037961697